MKKAGLPAKQLSLIRGSWTRDRFAFGGTLLKGSHAKTKRRFSSSVPMHVVMRSSQATGKLSLYKKSSGIAAVLEAQALRHHIKVYSVANAGNHLHLLVQAPSRENLSAFLRAITGRIAQLVMDPGDILRRTGFWDARNV